MAAAARELSIIYGTLTVGGSSTDFLLHGEYAAKIDQDQGTLEWDTIIVGTSDADFKLNMATFLAAMRDKGQRARVVQGAQTVIDWDPTATVNTGFQAEPHFETLANSSFTRGNQAHYRCRVVVQLPADTASLSAGLRDYDVIVKTSPSGVSTAEIRGQYTATVATLAIAQYTGNIGTLTSTVKALLGGTWEVVGNEYQVDDDNTTLTFRRYMAQPLLNQASGTLDHAAIKNQRLVVTRLDWRPGDSDASTRRPRKIAVLYEADIDKDQSTDLDGLWDGTIRPWLIEHAKSATGAANVALIKEDASFDGPQNRISGTLEINAYDTGTLLMSRVSVVVDDTFGILVDPVWSGRPYDAAVNLGRGIKLRTTTTDKFLLGSQARTAGTAGRTIGGQILPGTDLFQFGGNLSKLSWVDPEAPAGEGQGGRQQGPSGWVRFRTINESTPVIEGVEGYQVEMTHQRIVDFYIWRTVPAGFAGGGGGGSTGLGGGTVVASGGAR